MWGRLDRREFAHADLAAKELLRVCIGGHCLANGLHRVRGKMFKTISEIMRRPNVLAGLWGDETRSVNGARRTSALDLAAPLTFSYPIRLEVVKFFRLITDRQQAFASLMSAVVRTLAGLEALVALISSGESATRSS